MRILRPTAEGDDLAAKREAFLRPRVIREFLQKYDNAPIPKDEIAQNVLTEMGVPQDRTAEVLKLILEGADTVRFVQDIKDRKYVDLRNIEAPTEAPDKATEQNTQDEAAEPARAATDPLPPPTAKPAAASTTTDARARKVFITHGKNKALIEPIKKLLAFGELDAVVSVQTQTVSQPVPEKVMGEMRSCGAAIIHVEDERHLADKEGNEHIVLNDNVLIEIGAAMALFGQRFILVVKEGVKLPSNIQGLLELRYKGDTLDMEETVKLLEAINDMKKRPLPWLALPKRKAADLENKPMLHTPRRARIDPLVRFWSSARLWRRFRRGGPGIRVSCLPAVPRWSGFAGEPTTPNPS